MKQQETRSQRRAKMFKLIEAYLSNDQTQKAFCQQQSIKYSTFQFWLHKYRQTRIRETDQGKRSQEFIPIEVPSSNKISLHTQYAFAIEYPNGVILHLRHKDIDLLFRLIHVQEV